MRQTSTASWWNVQHRPGSVSSPIGRCPVGEVVSFVTRKRIGTGPVPTLQPADGKASTEQTAAGQVEADLHAPPLVGCLLLACPCGSSNMELWAHGVIVCARCQRLCGSAVWNYSSRQGPADAEHSPLPLNP